MRCGCAGVAKDAERGATDSVSAPRIALERFAHLALLPGAPAPLVAGRRLIDPSEVHCRSPRRRPGIGMARPATSSPPTNKPFIGARQRDDRQDREPESRSCSPRSARKTQRREGVTGLAPLSPSGDRRVGDMALICCRVLCALCGYLPFRGRLGCIAASSLSFEAAFSVVRDRCVVRTGCDGCRERRRAGTSGGRSALRPGAVRAAVEKERPGASAMRPAVRVLRGYAPWKTGGIAASSRFTSSRVRVLGPAHCSND